MPGRSHIWQYFARALYVYDIDIQYTIDPASIKRCIMRIHATLHNVPSLFSFSRIYSLSISSFCLFFSIVNWCWYKILINTYSDSYWYLNIMVVERLSLFALRVQTNDPNLSVKLKVYIKKDTASCSIKVFVVAFCSFDRQSRTFCEIAACKPAYSLDITPLDYYQFRSMRHGLSDVHFQLTNQIQRIHHLIDGLKL